MIEWVVKYEYHKPIVYACWEKNLAFHKTHEMLYSHGFMAV